MKQGCISGMYRGEDSTGFLQFGFNQVPRIRRSILNGYEFASMKKVDNMMESVDTAKATIIHHRKATMGSISIENCHPFEHETPDGRYVVGVHNGTIPNAPRKEDGLDFDVDSDWLYYKIATQGAEKALSLAEDGAYALVWHESWTDEEGTAHKKFFIACNEKRELHWGYVKDANVMLIASESAMLYWLADRNGIVLDKIFRPKKGLIYEFDVEKDLRQWTTKEILPAERKPTSDYGCAIGTAHSGGRWESNSRDFHGALGLDSTPFTMSQEVDFVYQSQSPIGNMNGVCKVVGEIITEVDGVPIVWPAVMNTVDVNAATMMKRANSVWCRVIGRRDEGTVGKGTTSYIMCTNPIAIEIEGDDDAPAALELAPFDDDDAETAMGRAINEWMENASGKTLRGPGGRYITVAEWTRLCSDGCSQCSAPLAIEEAEEVEWYDTMGGPLCTDCIIDVGNQLRAG